MLGAADPGGEVATPPPLSLDTLPESFEDGLETDEGPSEIEPFLDKIDFGDCDLDLERGGPTAGGGSGGG